MIETRFKDTEVGRIPEDWQVENITSIVQPQKASIKIGPFGSQLKKEFLEKSGLYKVYGQENVYSKDFDFCYRFLTEERFRSLQSCEIIPGDFLVSTMGTIGKCAIVPSGIHRGIMDSHLLRLRFRPIINKDWFAYFFASDITQKQISLLSVGGIMDGLSSKIIKNIQVVRPTDEMEQTRIATALSNIDALISELGKLIEKKRAIKQGAMQQLLTGKKRLKGFYEPWVEKKLGENATILRGGSPRPIENYITDSQDGLNWIKIGDVKPDDKYFRKTAEKIKKEGLAKTRQVKKGDFILSNSMSFGRPYILDIDGCIHDGWLVIQDYQEAYDMQFLYYVLCSDGVKDQYIAMAAGSSVQNLNKEKVANVILNAPVSLEEQTAIASVLTSMDNEIAALELKKSKYEQIKQGMMQQLLTGKIRLVETAVKTNTKSANVHFRRSVLAAEIAERLYEEPTFGHVKMEKMLFLTERLCHIDIGSHYHRDAAGPYDNRALRSIDIQLKKQKWFEVRRTEKGNRYVPMQNRGKHKTYFDKYYSAILPTFDKIIDTFKTQNTERCEIVATLYSAWEDLLHSNKPFTDADIVNEVLNNWHESKKRILQDRWLKAIQWMRNNGFAPNNNN